MPFLTRLQGWAGPREGDWTLTRPMLYRDPRTGVTYYTHQAFVSDLASIPRLARSLIPGNGHERQPAVLHDDVYRHQGVIHTVINPSILPFVADNHDPWRDADVHPTAIEAEIYYLADAGLLQLAPLQLTRSQGDSLFRRAMQCSRVNALRREVLWASVRVGGWMSFKSAAES